MSPSAHDDPDRRAIDAIRRAAHVFADAARPELGPVLAHLGAAPLVLVNRSGQATGGEVVTLARAIQESVYGRFGIRLEPEPVVL